MEEKRQKTESKLILHGNKLSPPVRFVLLAADAIQLHDIEFKYIDLANKEHLTEAFLKMNPKHTVPVLEDNGKFIWESHAIVTYLCDKYAPNTDLYPKDLYERAIVHQKLYFDAEVLYTRLRTISMAIYFEDKDHIPEYKINDVYEGYGHVEKFLELSRYLAGDKLTIADLCCMTTISSCQGFAPITMETYPMTYKWMRSIESLPYYERTNGKDAAIYVQFLKDQLDKKDKEKRDDGTEKKD